MSTYPLRTASVLLLALTLLLGGAYPLLVWTLGQTLWPQAANGSLIERQGHVIGSRLIGQSFSAPGYFWSRPSATTPQPYNATASNASNLGPLNPALLDQARGAIKSLRDADPGNDRPVSADLVSASASGLDPDISLAAARFQIERVARARQVAPAVIAQLVDRHVERPSLGFVGEYRLNVLELNLALDELAH